MHNHISVALGLLGSKSYRLTIICAHFILACAHHTRPRNVFKKGTLWHTQLIIISEQAKQCDNWCS